MSGIDQLVALRSFQGDFLTTIPQLDPATPVPWCGNWRAADLVEHLARIHHWAAGHASGKPATPLGDGPFEVEVLYAACAAELRETLARQDPDASVWTLLDDGLPPGTRTGNVRFWHRRQALETLVHLWDLRTAGGLDFEPGVEAWADCLDEVVTVMHPRQLRLGRIPPPIVAVRLAASDASAEHVLAGSPPGREVVVRGSARSLALLIWGRLGASDPSITIDGDSALLASVLAAGLTP